MLMGKETSLDKPDFQEIEEIIVSSNGQNFASQIGIPAESHIKSHNSTLNDPLKSASSSYSNALTHPKRVLRSSHLALFYISTCTVTLHPDAVFAMH